MQPQAGSQSEHKAEYKVPPRGRNCEARGSSGLWCGQVEPMFSLLTLLLLSSQEWKGVGGWGGVSVVHDQRESENLKHFWN